jgi:hypothetical protein
MMHLLQAFPKTLYIGLNAKVGYTKQKHLHACAFSVPLDRLLLESDAPDAIPAPLVQQMGSRKAFCHSACILYTAVAIAQQKQHQVVDVPFAAAVVGGGSSSGHRRTISPWDVAQITSRNTVQLYGGGDGDGNDDHNKNRLWYRAQQAKVAAEIRRQQQEQEPLLLQQHAMESMEPTGTSCSNIDTDHHNNKKKKNGDAADENRGGMTSSKKNKNSKMKKNPPKNKDFPKTNVDDEMENDQQLLELLAADMTTLGT